MSKSIKSVAIIGAGLMGRQIAGELISCGVNVLLLELSPPKGPRDAWLKKSMKAMKKDQPSPYLSESDLSRLTTGTFDENLELYTDDFAKIADVDLVLEVVIEDPVKKWNVYKHVLNYARKDAIIATNTSGIPISLLASRMPKEFGERFLGIHFFNPPSALPLLELIANPATNPEIINTVRTFFEQRLSKKVVQANDTPAFVGNRVGMFSIMLTLQAVLEGQISFAEAEILTGPLVGRPKSATFRTADVVGLHTLLKVTNHLYEHLPDDPQREVFKAPEFLEQMVAAGYTGAFSKEKKGFSTKDRATGQFLYINPETLEYEPSEVNLEDLSAIKRLANPIDRIAALLESEGRAGDFIRSTMLKFLQYCAARIPEITSDSSNVDTALRYGFGWEAGPFQIWDGIGAGKIAAAMRSQGLLLPQWVKQQLYNNDAIQSSPVLQPATLPVVIAQPASIVEDMGDGVLQFKITSKANSLGTAVLNGLSEALDLLEAEDKWVGMVIGDDAAKNFSSGADLAEIGQALLAGKLGEIELMLQSFQTLLTRLYSFPKPIVGAIRGFAFGGGAELALSLPHVVVSPLSFVGLVEMGMGVLPAGTGSTHLAYLAAKGALSSNLVDLVPQLRDKFMLIGMGQVSRNGVEAAEFGYLAPGYRLVRDPDALITAAKADVLRFAVGGYSPRLPREPFMVAGAEGRAQLQAGILNMLREGKISEYDSYLANKVAYVMTGGELTSPTVVPQEYLFGLERKEFIGLLQQPKTQERIRGFLTTGKRIRN